MTRFEIWLRSWLRRTGLTRLEAQVRDAGLEVVLEARHRGREAVGEAACRGDGPKRSRFGVASSAS